MSADVLELALALHRAPSRRFALRDRPLPDDIGTAIRLASATQPMLSEQAMRLSEPEGTLLEAVRFYLQQVLFDPGADAYRVLGLAPDAAQEQVRRHYRWLQRWLHPDRRGDDWEALFATRVNWAWQQLRNEASREAYDACRAQAPKAPHDTADDAAVSVPMGKWKAVPTTDTHIHWPRRIALGLSIGSSLVLLAIALIRGGPAPADGPAALSIASVPAQRAIVAGMLPPPTAGWPKPRLVIGDLPLSPPSGVVRVSIAVAPSVAAAIPHVPRSAVGPSSPHTGPVGFVRTSERAAAGKPSHDAAATIVAAPALPKTPVEETPAIRSEPAPAATFVAAAVRHVEPVRTVAADDTLARVELAGERLDELCAYFGRLDTRPPPLWNDLAGQLKAEHERTVMHRRSGAGDIARFEIEAPDWRLSSNSAALDAGYRLRSGRGIRESGRLSLSMVWRADMWLVTRVDLQPDR